PIKNQLALRPGETAFAVSCRVTGIVNGPGSCDARAFLSSLPSPAATRSDTVENPCAEQGTQLAVTRPFSLSLMHKRRVTGKLHLNKEAQKARQQLPNQPSDTFITCATVNIL